MNGYYPIISLPPNARERDEQMGTKEKFWHIHVDEHPWLFKFNRRGHGDDWSEKVATEIAGLLGLPHATVELAEFEGRPGVISRDFTNRGEHVLVHGNELMVEFINPQYPKDQNYGVTEHTVANVRSILSRNWFLPPLGVPPMKGVASAGDYFSGYLMLDALIGNTDRHHENWAVVGINKGESGGGARWETRLAPTFDHASCLGFNLSDAERVDRMTPGRNRSVKSFSDRAHSMLYSDINADKPLSPLEAFVLWTNGRPQIREVWIERLGTLADEDVRAIINRVPESRMSKAARDFCAALIQLNRTRIMAVR